MTVHFFHAPSGVRHSFVPKKIINYPLAQEASFLEANGVPVEIYNGQKGRSLDPESIAPNISPGDWIVTPLMEGTACWETLNFALQLKRLTNAHVVATSYLASFATEEIMAAFPSVDYIIKGEEETALLNLVTSEKQDKFQKIILGTPVEPSLWVFPEQSRWGVYGVLQTSRGCAHKCTFCSANAFGDPNGKPHWRALPVDIVQKWLRKSEENGVRFVEFVDADFLGSNAAGFQRGNDLASLGHIGISMMAATRADSIVRHANLIKKLRDFGIVKWQVGIESADVTTLRRYHKGLVPTTSFQAVDFLSDIGVSMRLEFIMFEPWSTLDTLKANLEMLAKLSEQNVLIQRGLFNRLRVGRWSPVIFKTLLRENRLIRHIFPLYDYEDYDPKVRAVWAAIRSCHDRKTGIAISLSLLIERLIDIGILNDKRANLISHLSSLDKILWRFVDKVVSCEGKMDENGCEVKSFHNDVDTWLSETMGFLQHLSLVVAFPGIIDWSLQLLRSIGIREADKLIIRLEENQLDEGIISNNRNITGTRC